MRRLTAAGVSCSAASLWSASCRIAFAQLPEALAQDRPLAIKSEIGRRASAQCRQPRLVVDYYRIHRKLSYPLPLPELSVPDVVVPGLPQYPWATWMLWAIEERIHSLGWAAEWLQDATAREMATADLAALSQWPKYQQYPQPDLSSAHAGRILWTASTAWRWVSEDLRSRVCEACRRHVDAVLPASDKLFASLRTKEDLLRQDAPHTLLHNIPLIGTIGAALTAAAARHPAAEMLNARVEMLFGATLDLRTKGFTEGLAYDGYVLDFIADWLGMIPEQVRCSILDHPNFDQYLEQSYMLSAPGAVEQAAELSDVEPREMPFHLSAQAKLLRWRNNSVRRWLMAHCPLGWLRTDALAALCQIAGEPADAAPRCGALDAHYAAVLRSGWDADDLAVAVSCTASPMSHIQCDNGTLVIGTQGTWLIADPGYQQYVEGDERNFTIGPTAHNTPLIHGHAQTRKMPRRIALHDVGPDVHHVAIDLAACYPQSALLKKLIRHVWLAGKNLVVVADQIESETSPPVAYHWHAHQGCAWWFERNWALVSLGAAQLWFTCPQAKLSGENLQRLPGSKGQLTLSATIDAAPATIWWVFASVSQPPTLHIDSDGRQLHVEERTFRV